MTNPSSALKGVIHGNMIELDQAPELPDGQEVSVVLEPIKVSVPILNPAFVSEDARHLWEQAWAQVKDLRPGDGLRQAFGTWADDAEEVDRFLEWNHAQRGLERRSPEL